MFTSFLERLNDRRDAAGDAGVDAGFTLIELMVVLLILAILLAIAIPTFLGLTGGANDRAAQSNLNTALTNAKSAAAENNQTYGGLTTAEMATNEPAIQWVGGAVNKAGPVSIYLDPVPDGAGVALASWSPNNQGTCWFAVDNLAAEATLPSGPFVTAASTGSNTSDPTIAGTFYGVEPDTTSAHCSATAAPVNATTWQQSGWPSN